MFGGVQIFQILINWARGKCLAVLLGPEGMGISSLFNSASNTLQKFSSLGLNLAIVREIAEKSNEKESVGAFVALSLRILLVTSLIGALICVLFATPLSRLTFGNTDMAWQFMLLGVAVAFGVAGTGILSMLQGLHEVKRLSKASIVGGLTGLLIGVPLYYFYGTKGIVPAMIALSVTMFMFYYLSLRKSFGPSSFRFSLKEHAPVIKRMIALGIILMASDLIGTLVTYGINIFIEKFGSISDIGLYQAANSATAQYSGMVFTAMAMDYFPRLTKAASDNQKMHAIVNRQSEIVSLIIVPAATLLIITAPIVIRVLFTREYEPILPLMRWMGLGITFRALMVPMAYITFAKGDKRIFFYLEGLFGNVLTFTLSCLGFYFFGLIGLGYALLADNVLCLIVYYVVNHHIYGYTFTAESLKGMAVAILTTTLCFLFSLIENPAWSYSLMAVVFAVSLTWSLVNLRRKLRTPDTPDAE